MGIQVPSTFMVIIFIILVRFRFSDGFVHMVYFNGFVFIENRS